MAEYQPPSFSILQPFLQVGDRDTLPPTPNLSVILALCLFHLVLLLLLLLCFLAYLLFF